MLLMLGSMVVTPSQNLRAQQEPVVVYGWVFDDTNGDENFDEPLESGLDGVQVDLHDVSSTDPVSYSTDGGGYFEFEISRPSYYKIGIDSPGESLEEGKVYFGNETAVFRVYDENVDVGYVGLKSRIVNATISGAVTDGGTGDPINDATVTLRDRANNYEISQQTYPIHEYENSRDKWMISPEIILPDSSSIKLTFRQWYWMEDGRDGGNVQISTDGGGSWEVLEPYYNVYPDPNVVDGEPGYTGKRGWHEVRINLLPWEGSTVNIAFRFTSDSSNVDEGWYIDIIRVVADAETIFSDDAESEEPVGWTFQPSEDPWQISDHNYETSSPSHSWYCGLDIEGWYSIDTYDGDYEIEVLHEDYSPTFLLTTVQPNNIMASFKNTRIIPSYETLYLNGNPIDNASYQIDYPNGKINFNMTIDDTDEVTADYDYKVFIENESLAFGALGGESGAALAHNNITNDTLYLNGSIWTNYTLNNMTGVVTYDDNLVRGTMVWADYTYNGTNDVFGEILTSTGVLSLHPVDALSVTVWIDGSPTINYTLDDVNGEIAFIEPVHNTSLVTVSYDAIVSVVGETVQLTGGTRADIELFRYRITGRALEAPDGPGITDTPIHVAVYDLSNSRVLTTTVDTAPSFWIGVYPETFVVVVRIDGYKSITIPSVTVTDATIPLGEQYFEKSEEEQIEHEITFISNDWNNFTLSTSWKLNSESYLDGMDYAELHNIRLQVDVVLGNGDGILNVSEISALESWLLDKGPRYVITDEFFLTDDSHYVSKHNSFNVSAEPNASSSVNSTEPLWINASTIFNTTGIESGADEYLLTQFVDYDTTVMGQTQKNYTYRIELPTQDGKRYEMVENDTVPGVEVKGFLTIRIDPPQGSGGPVRVDMTVRPSENGTAKIEITDPIDPLDGVTILNSTYDNYTAVVRANLNITFSAESSTDPNSPTGRVQPHQNFTWIFNKSNPVESTRYDITAVYNYTIGDKHTVNLTISESGIEPGGNVTYQEATIFVDDLDPVAYISVNVTDPEEGFDPANDRTIEVNESVAVILNAEKSIDHRYGSVEGSVTNWKWDLENDGTWDEFLSNFTYAFAQPGDYTVNVTVADEVGHWSSNVSVYFVIKDITPPTVRVAILNDTYIPKSSATENRTFWFNASETSDNYDEVDNLTFGWDFGDGTIIPAAVGNYNVSHNYTRIDTYNLTVNVTDKAGNAGNATITIPVLVDAASRPDLEVVPGTFTKEPESVEEGKNVKLSVNLTNKIGHAVAQNVEVHFYLVEGDDEKEIGAGSLKFYNESGLISGSVKIDVEEQVTAEISWTPDVVGKLTIVVRIRDAEEHSQQIGTDNSMTEFLTVEQAPWKTWLVYIVLIVIIFVVIVVVWLRRKWQRGELKLRRKEKEEPKEKKKKK
jgi:PKD repeat protein